MIKRDHRARVKNILVVLDLEQSIEIVLMDQYTKSPGKTLVKGTAGELLTLLDDPIANRRLYYLDVQDNKLIFYI